MWALLGTIEQSKDKWICLQVASSVDICNEIVSDIECMTPITPQDKKTWKSQFHRDGVFDVIYGLDVRCQKYRNICERFDYFCIVLIDHKEYLKGIDTTGYDPMKYAEVKFAYDTQAFYWNPIKKEFDILKRLEK